MSRPLRIEFEGAVYHVTSRGDRREPIFVDDDDRHRLLAVVGQATERFDAQVLAYCLMGNPVRASLVDRAEAWRWSSYAAHIGLTPAPPWLDTAGLHACLLGRAPRGAADGRRAAERYAALVAAGRDVRLWSDALRHQIYLGDEAFVERMQARAEPRRRHSPEVPRAQRRTGGDLERYLRESSSREEGLRRAHTEGAMTMSGIARRLGLSVSRVSRLIARAELSGDRGEAKGKT